MRATVQVRVDESGMLRPLSMALLKVCIVRVGVRVTVTVTVAESSIVEVTINSIAERVYR